MDLFQPSTPKPHYSFTKHKSIKYPALKNQKQKQQNKNKSVQVRNYMYTHKMI